MVVSKIRKVIELIFLKITDDMNQIAKYGTWCGSFFYIKFRSLILPILFTNSTKMHKNRCRCYRSSTGIIHKILKCGESIVVNVINHRLSKGFHWPERNLKLINCFD